jgi:hypothetical protein
MFDNNSADIINWLENLEETCHNLIFDKSEAWFQNSLDKNDIDGAFNSVIRIYKSGKYYLVRTFIKTNNNEPSVKIYNENEVSMTINDVNNETNIISILEIQGIKFTQRNFQIEIELKQVMILDNEPIFDSCLIKTSKRENQNNKLDCLEIKEQNTDSFQIDDTYLEDLNTNFENMEEPLKDDLKDNLTNDFKNDLKDDFKNDDPLDLNIEELTIEENDDLDELKEVDITLDLGENETMKLKKPNEVYFELYKEARNKAKEAKKNAIIAYLEAKNIKKTYMLDILDENESDIDAEIDEISDTELDNL